MNSVVTYKPKLHLKLAFLFFIRLPNRWSFFKMRMEVCFQGLLKSLERTRYMFQGTKLTEHARFICIDQKAAGAHGGQNHQALIEQLLITRKNQEVFLSDYALGVLCSYHSITSHCVVALILTRPFLLAILSFSHPLPPPPQKKKTT